MSNVKTNAVNQQVMSEEESAEMFEGVINTLSSIVELNDGPNAEEISELLSSVVDHVKNIKTMCDIDKQVNKDLLERQADLEEEYASLEDDISDMEKLSKIDDMSDAEILKFVEKLQADNDRLTERNKELESESQVLQSDINAMAVADDDEEE